jgi:hypothetical protein
MTTAIPLIEAIDAGRRIVEGELAGRAVVTVGNIDG